MGQYYTQIQDVFAGKSMVRSFLDLRLRGEMLAGKILDLGSGGSDRYSDMVPREMGATYTLFDQKKGQEVDFETDALPYPDGTFDTIVLLNVLEHIYHHRHLLEEVRRIKRSTGKLVGFVPFLMWYHPDPHDFYRYTHESLERILTETGYHDVRIEAIYFGPYIAAFQMIHTTMPRPVRMICFSCAYLLDRLFRWVRPKAAARYALGYYFTAQ